MQVKAKQYQRDVTERDSKRMNAKTIEPMTWQQVEIIPVE